MPEGRGDARALGLIALAVAAAFALTRLGWPANAYRDSDFF